MHMYVRYHASVLLFCMKVGAGARAGGAYACIGVGGAYRPVQCCRDTVLRVEPSLHSQRLSS